MMFFGCNVSNINPLIYVLMNIKSVEQITNINSNESIFYPYSIKVNICRGSCNNINDPYSKLCVTDVVKNIIVNRS